LHDEVIVLGEDVVLINRGIAENSVDWKIVDDMKVAGDRLFVASKLPGTMPSVYMVEPSIS
jgi:hypothetical protein